MPIAWPRRSSGARSTIHVTPAVKTQPSPNPTTRRAMKRPNTPSGRNSIAPPTVTTAAPTRWTHLRPRVSASRPPIGRPMKAVSANAPTTSPTDTSPAPSGPFT